MDTYVNIASGEHVRAEQVERDHIPDDVHLLAHATLTDDNVIAHLRSGGAIYPVRLNDWIVEMPNGLKIVLTQRVFERMFDRCVPPPMDTGDVDLPTIGTP